jgi:hypothetical protein
VFLAYASIRGLACFASLGVESFNIG